jgi:hypothetical protein
LSATAGAVSSCPGRSSRLSPRTEVAGSGLVLGARRPTPHVPHLAPVRFWLKWPGLPTEPRPPKGLVRATNRSASRTGRQTSRRAGTDSGTARTTRGAQLDEPGPDECPAASRHLIHGGRPTRGTLLSGGKTLCPAHFPLGRDTPGHHKRCPIADGGPSWRRLEANANRPAGRVQPALSAWETAAYQGAASRCGNNASRVTRGMRIGPRSNARASP